MRLLILSLLACIFLTGCSSERVVVYRYYDEPVYRPAPVYVPVVHSYTYSSYSSTSYGFSGGYSSYSSHGHCAPVVVRPVCRPVPVCRPAPSRVYIRIGR